MAERANGTNDAIRDKHAVSDPVYEARSKIVSKEMVDDRRVPPHFHGCVVQVSCMLYGGSARRELHAVRRERGSAFVHSGGGVSQRCADFAAASIHAGGLYYGGLRDNRYIPCRARVR